MKISSLFKKSGKADGASVPDEVTSGMDGEAETDTAAAGPAEKSSRFGPGVKGSKMSRGSDTKLAVNGPVALHYVDRGVLRLGSRNFAVGLVWVPAIDDANLKAHAEVAAEVAKSIRLPEVEFTFVTGSVDDGLLGFGTGDLGHKPRMPSLVKSIRHDVAGPNWLIALKASGYDLWWIGSVRDDVVFLDRIFTNEENAMVVFMEAMSAPGWNTIVAPEDWHIQKAGATLDGAMVAEKGARLRHYDPLKAYGPRILFASVLTVGIGGIILYYVAEQRRFEAAQAERRAMLERAVTLSPQDFPWFSKPSISSFTEACSREIERAVVFAAGWENQVFTCTVDRGFGTVQTGWQREGGTISWLRAALPPHFPEISVAEGLDIATVQTSFDLPLTFSEIVEQPWSRELIESRLPERFQAKGVEHTMRFVEDLSPPETSALFHRHDVQVQGDMALEDLGPLLADLPALIPETLIYNLSTSGWSFVFRIHHPVIVPEVTQP